MKYFFNSWDNLKEKLARSYLFIFLDFDGTLAPIADTPRQAVLSKQVRDLLKKISALDRCKLAIVSGRQIDNIKKIIGLEKIIYAGNHGLEIKGPKIKFQAAVGPKYKAALRQLKSKLENRLSAIKGVLIEDKGLTLSIHYRLVNKRDANKLKVIFQQTIAFEVAKNQIKIKPGKKVFEVRPPLQWDKGKVVLWLLSRQKLFLKKENILPIYVGDDITDEDAFGALKNRGLTIFVGRPGNSSAQYYLKNTKEVQNFLSKVLELRQGN